MLPLLDLVVWMPVALVLGGVQDDPPALSGQLVDVNGAVIVGASVELYPEPNPGIRLRTETNSIGAYEFRGLESGEYALSVHRSGFRRVRIRSIRLSGGEHKVMPTLTLAVWPASVTDDLDFWRFLQAGDHVGDLSGAVTLHSDLPAKQRAPIHGARVVLVCFADRDCAVTNTDSLGQFHFSSLAPGKYGIRVTRPGFYQAYVPNYEVEAGRERVYLPLELERCHLGNCDPKLRPKRPLMIIE